MPETHKPIPLDRLFCTYMIIVSRYGSNAPDETSLDTISSGLNSLSGFDGNNINKPSTFSAFSEINKRGGKIINDYGDSYLISSVSYNIS